jgi:hypothetical protein
MPLVIYNLLCMLWIYTTCIYVSAAENVSNMTRTKWFFTMIITKMAVSTCVAVLVYVFNINDITEVLKILQIIGVLVLVTTVADVGIIVAMTGSSTIVADSWPGNASAVIRLSALSFAVTLYTTFHYVFRQDGIETS